MYTAKKLDLETMFREEYMTTRDDVICALENMEQQWLRSDETYNKDYNLHVGAFIHEFRDIVEKHQLFDCPPGLWGYSVTLRGGGIFLYLNHYQKAPWQMMKENIFFALDESYELLCQKTKLLTVEEYAALHNVEHVTAVTRIRRGKIRSAVKVGSQWRIPALAQPVQRGYQATEYIWRGRLTGLPDKYRILEEYNRAQFFQDEEDLTVFHVRFLGEAAEPMEFTCAREQRGKIEQLLIAHPDVTCLSDVICSVERKQR